MKQVFHLRCWIGIHRWYPRFIGYAGINACDGTPFSIKEQPERQVCKRCKLVRTYEVKK